MGLKTTGLLSTVLLLILVGGYVGACSPSPPTGATSRMNSTCGPKDDDCDSANARRNSSSEDDHRGSDGDADSNDSDFDSFDPDTAVPNYRNEQLPGRFNEDSIEVEQVDPSLQGKVFQVSRVPYYRILWMNLSQSTWTDTVHHWINNNLATPLSNAGATAPLPYDAHQDPDQISIFQPMPRLRTDALEQGGYRVVGYTAHASLTMPSFPTAVLAAVPGQPADIWTQAADYELVFSLGVPGYPQLYEQCLTQEAQIAMAVNTQLQDICSGYLPEIFGNFSNINQSSYSIDGSGAPTRWKNWFDVITIGIWKPVPPPGYKCLGYAASNGELDKPKVELANPQYGPTYQSEQAGLYCIKEDYVTEGRIGRLIRRTKDGRVALYRIRAKDPKIGYDKANFFYAKAFPPLKLQKDEKVWVLKKAILKEHPDDKLRSKD